MKKMAGVENVEPRLNEGKAIIKLKAGNQVRFDDLRLAGSQLLGFKVSAPGVEYFLRSIRKRQARDLSARKILGNTYWRGSVKSIKSPRVSESLEYLKRDILGGSIGIAIDVFPAGGVVWIDHQLEPLQQAE